jgi:hypothetical protein
MWVLQEMKSKTRFQPKTLALMLGRENLNVATKKLEAADRQVSIPSKF